MNDTVKATSLEAVIAAIRVERAYQDRIWGGKEHDAQHPPQAWIALILEHGLAADRETHSPDGLPFFLKEVRQIAALCVACLEVHGLTGPKP